MSSEKSAGRRFFLSGEQLAKARKLMTEHGLSAADVARRFGVKPDTLTEALRRQRREAEGVGE